MAGFDVCPYIASTSEETVQAVSELRQFIAFLTASWVMASSRTWLMLRVVLRRAIDCFESDSSWNAEGIQKFGLSQVLACDRATVLDK